MSQIISLDIGTGFVKTCSIHNRIRFSSLYAYRDIDPWENGKRNGVIIEGSGYDAVEIARHPSAVILRPVREDIPSNKIAFMAVVKQAIKNLEISDDVMPETSIIIGLPYHAAKDATKFPSFVKKITNCRDTIVVPQTIGTLMSSEKKDGIVLAIRQGTTELVAFDNLKPILGRSIQQACDYVYLGANDLEYLNSNKPNPKRVEMLADIISENLASFKTNLSANNSYDIIVSGEGLLVRGLYNHLKRKIGDSLHTVKDPIFSNAVEC